MKIRMALRMAAVTAALAGGLAAGGTTSVKWAGGTASAAGGPCANYQLLMKPISSDGAAGRISEMFRIHDLLPGSCTLFGYPGALLLDRNFVSLPTHVARSPFPQGGAGPTLVTLDRHHNAYFVLSWEHIPSPGQTCPPAPYLMIIAPNNHLPVVTHAGNGDGNAGIMACGGIVTASPVSATRFWR